MQHLLQTELWSLWANKQNRDGILLVSGLRGRSFAQLQPKIEKLLSETGLDIGDIISVQLFVRDLRSGLWFSGRSPVIPLVTLLV